MAMNARTRSLAFLGALAALAAGAALYAYYGVHLRQREKQEIEKKQARLFEADKSAVTRLTVTAKGQTTILNRKADGGWAIVSPINTEADQQTVDALLDRLLGLSRTSVVEKEPKDLARYGLVNPGLTVVARLQDGRELTLRSGAQNAFDNSVYVTTGAGDEVLQVEGGFKWALEKDTFDLRDKRLLPFEEADVSEVRVKVGQIQYGFQRTEDGWQLLPPLAHRAEETTVNRVLQALRNLRATRIVTEVTSPEQERRYGLTKPKLEATVATQGGNTMTLLAGQADVDGQKTFAKRRDGLFVAEVPSSIIDTLTVKSGDLRDKTVVRFDREQVQGLRVFLGDITQVLKRASGSDAGADAWAVTEPEPARAQQWRVSALLGSLAGLKAADVAHEAPSDLASFGLAPPVRSIALLDGDGKELASVHVGKESSDRVYLKSSTDPRVFEVEKHRIADWPKVRSDLEEPTGPAPDAGAGG